MNFDDTQRELYLYIIKHPILRIFVPISEVVLIGGLIVIFISQFLLHLGIITTLMTILVYIAMVVTLAKANYKILLIGLILKSLICLLLVIGNLFKEHSSLDLNNAVYFVVWGYLTFIAYRKYVKKSTFE